MSSKTKQKRHGVPFQIFEDKDKLYEFDKVAQAYGLNRTEAVRRLMQESIDTHHIPGFIHKSGVIENPLAASNKVDKYILDKKLNS